MLEFYDFLWSNYDTRFFELIEMDTGMYRPFVIVAIAWQCMALLQYYRPQCLFLDSLYIGISEKEFGDLPTKNNRPIPDEIKYSFLCHEKPEDQAKYDMRTPGLFKVEWQGDKMICLCSKTYVAVNNEKEDGDKDKTKISCKGLSKKTNQLLYEHYAEVLRTGVSYTGTNIGFRPLPMGQLNKYVQKRDGLTNFYCKRRVLADGITTEALDLK